VDPLEPLPASGVAGAFLVRPGFAAIRDAFRCHGIDESVRQELPSIVSIEVEVGDASGRLDLGE
jgi:hypothetical protein